MSDTLRALRHAARALARSPQFAITAILTLALAIGTNASIFSVVQGVLLKPLPYHEPDRIVQLNHTAPDLGYDSFGMSPALFRLYTGDGGPFEASGLLAETSLNLTGDGASPERLDAVRASRGVFTTLAAQPAAGRLFTADEDRPGGPRVALLSHALWRDRFGGDASIVGRTVRIDGEATTVVGVMPATFEFPSRETRLWVPLQADTTGDDFGNFTFDAIARLREGTSAADAQSMIRPRLQRLREENQDLGDFVLFMDAGDLSILVTPLREMIVGDVSRALWILLGTVGFVFLIACANVTNLFLVRAEARQKEMAVRAALGAKRTGLIGHYTLEAALVAGAGGVLGLVLTFGALRALLRVAPPNLPRLDEVSIDPVVLAFTALVTIIAAVLLGIVPALRLTSPDLLATLGRAARGTSSGRERHRARQVLVIAQTALALILLVGSGLMIRSFQNMRALDTGFDASDALTFRLSLPASTYPDAEQVARFHANLLERLRAIPGVEHAGATSHPPLRGCCSGTAHVIEDHPVEAGEASPIFWYSTVTDGYFDAMGIPVVRGRAFESVDRDTARYNVVISEALARQYWPDGDPVGRRIRLSSLPDVWFSIVGVATSVRDRALEEDPSLMVYYPVSARSQGQSRSMTYVLRTTRPDPIAPLARAEVWALDPELPIAASATYDEIVSDAMARISFTMLALVAAAAIALVLGAIGLYGVISYIVTQRTNELGIRLALGARPDQVRRMVVAQGVRFALIGLAIGIAGALALTSLMESMLFGTAPTDPLTFIAVSTFLMAIALLATYVPARRASRTDPAASLKIE